MLDGLQVGGQVPELGLHQELVARRLLWLKHGGGAVLGNLWIICIRKVFFCILHRNLKMTIPIFLIEEHILSK